MKQEQLLQSATAWQSRQRPASRLGEGIEIYLGKQTGPQATQGNSVAEALMELLPRGLRDNCNPQQYEHGTLYVKAAPGAYVHELCMMRGELLEQLQQRCPGAKLKEIRIRAGV